MSDTPAADIMESVIAKGDLAKLTAAEHTEYYLQTCRSLGLNPLTQPFSYLTLNNKLILYANRACADQLRKVNSVSLEVVSERVVDDILTVHVRARLPDGRIDEDWGSVPFPSTLKGDFRANMKLKAITKAKRRATLSICGLGWLDELEIEDIPAGRTRPPRPQPEVLLPQQLDNPVATANSEPTAPDGYLPVSDQTVVGSDLSFAELESLAKQEARQGEKVFRKFYHSRSPAEQAQLNAMGEELRDLMKTQSKGEKTT